MGIIYKHLYALLFGLILVIANLYCIRTQCFVNEKQYKLGMIPHHSMAVLMSKKLLKKPNNIQNFLKNLIATQDDEINFLKAPSHFLKGANPKHQPLLYERGYTPPKY